MYNTNSRPDMVIPKLQLSIINTVGQPHPIHAPNLSPRAAACLSNNSPPVSPTSWTITAEIQKRIMTPRGRRQSLKINTPLHLLPQLPPESPSSPEKNL